jgi:hypothetical protein
MEGLCAACRCVGGRAPAADLRPDRRHGRRNDAKVFLQPSQGNGKPLGVSSAKVVRGGMRLRREVFDPDDLLRVGIGQRGGSRPSTAVPRAAPNVVVALAGHGANDTRGGLPFQASWEHGAPGEGLLGSSYPTDLLPKAVLIFSPRQAFAPAAGSSVERTNAKTKRPPRGWPLTCIAINGRAAARKACDRSSTKRCTPK